MKDERKYAAEQATSKEEASKKDREEKSEEFLEKGRGGLREGVKRFETCYTCDQKAVGNEHAPPKGLFPKHLRNGIITVPACLLHNQEKTLEDEYFRNAVVSTLDKNTEGLAVVDSVIRSWEYKPHLLNLPPEFQEGSS